MSSNKPLLKSSTGTIRNLLPYINEDGLLVLSESNIPLRHREPYILPYGYHNKAHHGVELTLSDVRERFYITKTRIIARRVKYNCITCTRIFASTNI